MPKEQISEAITGFATAPTREAALALFDVLGYHSDKTVDTQSVEEFLETFDQDRKLNHDKALVSEWRSANCLFQITNEDVQHTEQAVFAFEDASRYKSQIIESYLFLSIDLKQDHYTRTALAQVTRAVNGLFAMPALILFRHNHHFTLSVINRRLHKRDKARDVLEKVTLIKDVSIEAPHRAHIEILHDLALPQLQQRHNCRDFVGLHNAWQKTLDSSELNKRFFQEIANWYFWAVDTVTFPMPDTVTDEHAYKAQNVIRLITRLIFCWFIKEKGLLPEAIFNPNIAPTLLKNGDCTKRAKRDGTVPVFQDDSAYYKAILQNLFFATLNQEMGKREFRKDGQNFMAHTLYRYKAFLKDPEAFLALLNEVPFLNGGLFECLDKREGTKEKPIDIRMDGFSDRKDNPLYVPDGLFFGEEHTLDLNSAYGTRNKRYTVRGIIHTLNLYKFTIEENTPIEEEIALDPELLGRVFENLLAAYNPETGATARKQTGSFYTPREIVNYMVDEALIARLSDLLQEQFPKAKKIEEKLRHLFAYNQEPHQFNEEQAQALIAAIDKLKILDPACGSGAFPMGVIHKLVFILSKLDPGNEGWKNRQIERTGAIEDSTMRDLAIADIEKAFRENALDYGRKLYLIGNCIYGVDIQPIAVQIAKLRFLISLIVDQQVHTEKPNRGIRPLPNLETKIVAANTLIPIQRIGQTELRSPDIAAKEESLKKVRNNHFNAKTPGEKRSCREKDKLLRNEIATLLIHEGWPDDTAKKLASWDPYDPNINADFFDAEWMFQITEGFDIVIANPPYIFARESKKKGITGEQKKYYYENYALAEYQVNLYPLFVEAGTYLLKAKGCLSFITPNNWLTLGTNKKMREFVFQYSYVTIVNFYAQVFESASVDSAIIIYRRSGESRTTRLFEYKESLTFVKECNSESFLKDDQCIVNFAVQKNSGIENLLEKIDRHSQELCHYTKVKAGIKAYEVGKGRPPQTLEMKDSRVYHSKSKLDDTYLMYLDGKDVCRYSLRWSGEYIKYGINLAAPRKDFSLFSSNRILVRQIPAQPPYCVHACYVEGIYINDLNSMNVVNIDGNLKVFLGILNSRLTSWWFVHKFGKLQRKTFPQFKVNELATFPIPKNYVKYSDEIADNVKLLLERKKNDVSFDARKLEQEIDRLVYDLYELTEDEITIVESE